MSKKHTARKNAVAPVAVAVLVVGINQFLTSGLTLEAGLLCLAGTGLFAVYHLLDERQVQEAVPGDFEDDIQQAVSQLDEEDLRTVTETGADRFENNSDG